MRSVTVGPTDQWSVLSGGGRSEVRGGFVCLWSTPEVPAAGHLAVLTAAGTVINGNRTQEKHEATLRS